MRPFLLLILAALPLTPKTVVLWEPGFPTIDSELPPRTALEQALPNATFAPLADLDRLCANDDLLVLPYGSAFPLDAWPTIRRKAANGSLLILGGRPLFVPVARAANNAWRPAHLQNTYAHTLGIDHTYIAPQHDFTRLAWDAAAPAFHTPTIKARHVFVAASEGAAGRYRGLGYFLSPSGDRLSAPVTADDVHNQSRRVYLAFYPEPGYWASSAGIQLIREAAQYAAAGPLRLWLDLPKLTLAPGDRPTATLDLSRVANTPAELTLELQPGNAKLTLPVAQYLHQDIAFETPLAQPGLHTLTATLSQAGVPLERYRTGFYVRDLALLHSGQSLTAARDYFRLDGKPYLPIGANYFGTDPYGASFFVGGSLGGNAWAWDRDFAEMERHGLTFIRTGVWLNRARYLDPITGTASPRFLDALEAFLHAAARHHMQVVFTFFAFEPQTLAQPGPGQETGLLGPGANPYTDPVARQAQANWIGSIVSRFKDVPFLSFDLINEPSFSNPRRLWKGNTPNADPTEQAAWHAWLASRYQAPAALAAAWQTPLSGIPTFDAVPLPDPAGLDLARYGNHRLARAFDYNLFAQDMFRDWATAMVKTIRGHGARQPITVGQDEGGVSNRVLNHFHGDAPLDYTVNHTWWRDDALLWDSLAAKRPDKPNLIGETGPQPVWSIGGLWRWDDVNGLPLAERKLALGFAAGNAGALHWDWARGDTFGLLRRDGSYKQWMDALTGLAAFARQAAPYATGVRPPEVAIVLPQSLQLSVFNNWALEAQQKSVRALYHYARASAYTVGEYQLDLLGDPKLIIVPSPWVLNEGAWRKLRMKVHEGATVLISGRTDLDEHFQPAPNRLNEAGAALTARETKLTWHPASATLSYSADKTTYAERALLQDGAEVQEREEGKGRFLHIAVPLELADNLDVIGRIYRYAVTRAEVHPDYATTLEDPGILICPTRLPEATLYVLTSESSTPAAVAFQDLASQTEIKTTLDPGRAAVLLVRHNGQIAASYGLR